MYPGTPLDMRQYAGMGDAEESNKRYKYLLANGTTGPFRRLRLAHANRTAIPIIRFATGRSGQSRGRDRFDRRYCSGLFDGIELTKISTR